MELLYLFYMSFEATESLSILFKNKHTMKNISCFQEQNGNILWSLTLIPNLITAITDCRAACPKHLPFPTCNLRLM
jgi:hypothetical protein